MDGLPADQRWSTLLDALAERGRLSVAEGAALLGVSPATVRRDFAALDQRQLATRTHGGVVAAAVAYELPTRYRTSASDPRVRIAEASARLAGAGQVVGFNGGATVSAVARALGARTDLSDSGGVTVVTNALNIAAELVLRPHLRVVCLGGEARPESYELHGPFAQHVLRSLHVDLLFLGVGGISVEHGVSCAHLGESVTNAEMVRRAGRVAVVATATKLGVGALARICSLDAVDRLITDEGADPAQVDALRAAGLEVTLV